MSLVALVVLTGWLAVTMFLGVLVLPLCSCFVPRLLPPRNAHDRGKKKNVLLVIAHPDDESMFFGPTLLSLASLKIYNVSVLCISSGNSENKGWQRKIEILAACSVLKGRSQIPGDSVEVMDVAELQDGFSEHWDAELVAQIVRQRILDHDINILVTFDSYGVSGHPNHRSVHHAIRVLLTQLKSKGDNNEIGIEAWQLVSSCLIRKYSGPLDVFVSLVECSLLDPAKHHCFFSQDPWTNAKAMGEHKSQLLWYRKLFVVFSRYTYVNILKPVVV